MSFFVLVVDVEQVWVREVRVLEGLEVGERPAVGLGVGMVAARALQ